VANLERTRIRDSRQSRLCLIPDRGQIYDKNHDLPPLEQVLYSVRVVQDPKHCRAICDKTVLCKWPPKLTVMAMKMGYYLAHLLKG